MTRHLEFDECVTAAHKALTYAIELDASQERGLVIAAAKRLLDELRYFEKVQTKLEAERAR